MKVMSKEEEAAVSNVESLDSAILSQQGLGATFKLSRFARAQTILASKLAAILCDQRGCWVEITYRNDDEDSNLDLFYGYRTGMGEDRKLADASVHRFLPDDRVQFASIVGMILYFSRDARIFDDGEAYRVNISNDEMLDLVGGSDDLHRELAGIFAIFN